MQALIDKWEDENEDNDEKAAPFRTAVVLCRSDKTNAQWTATFAAEVFARRFHEYLQMLHSIDELKALYFWYTFIDPTEDTNKTKTRDIYNALSCGSLVERAVWTRASSARVERSLEETNTAPFTWSELEKSGNVGVVFRIQD